MIEGWARSRLQSRSTFELLISLAYHPYFELLGLCQWPEGDSPEFSFDPEALDPLAAVCGLSLDEPAASHGLNPPSTTAQQVKTAFENEELQ
jgi:hypothetical protein